MTQPYDTGQPGVFTFSQPVNVNPSGVSSGITDAASINAAISSLPANGGLIRLNPGVPWNIAGGQVVVNRSGVWIDATGCFINAVGSGDVFRMFDTTNPVTRSVNGGGIIGRPIIDGTNAGANSTGIHYGDIELGRIDAIIQKFTGAGSTGLLLDNANWWSEENDIRVTSSNCTSLVTFTQSNAGASTSFGYGNYDFTLFQGQGNNQQPGLSILGGAFVYHSSLRMRGNFFSAAAATTASALVVSGQNGVGAASSLQANRFDIQVECSSGGANSPKTISMSTSPFASAYGNYGILDFAHGSGSFAPSTITNAQFAFSGIVTGDSNLAPVGNGLGSWVNVFSPVIYNDSNSIGGSIPTTIGDFSAFTLTANTTINLNPGALNGGKTLGVPQRVTVVITQAAAGGFTVTWPHNGAPTISAPSVKWAGGTAPIMTATANAVDVYELSTIDGATWYGRATQNVS